MKLTNNHDKFLVWKQLLIYSPVLIAILIMIPRLLSPQFGLLDDGKSIITSQDIARGEWDFRFDSTDARFRPLYWLSFALPYFVVGEQPIWFFLMNAFVLCLTIIAMIAFLQKLSVKPWQTWLAGIFFVLSGAIIENFYTLSKGEWLQVMFIAMSLLAITGYSSTETIRRKAITVAGASLLLVFAMLSKETSVVILAVGSAWVVLDWFWAKHTTSYKQSWRAPYLVSSIISVGFYFVLRVFYTTSVVTTSGYTERYTFTLPQMITSAVRWAGWLVRDHTYLTIIIMLVIVLLVIRRGLSQLQLALDMVIWMVAWVAVYLPWNYMTEYYMLPFAFGAACFAGVVLGDPAVWRSLPIKMLAGLAVMLLIVSSVNNITTARIQLLVDSTNSQMLNDLAKLSPASIVYLNIQSANEYTDQIAMQLAKRYNRSDIVVQLFNSAMGIPKSCQISTCFIVTPQVDNQPLMTVRMGVFEPTQDGWNEDLQKYLKNLSGWEKDLVLIDSFQMLSVDFPRLFCGLIETRAFCATSSSFLDTRQFQYGWTVYKLDN